MTDEAHRSQYKLLGANLDKGIPNAAKIGYTGTPIDRPRSSLATTSTSTRCGSPSMMVSPWRSSMRAAPTTQKYPTRKAWMRRLRMCSAITIFTQRLDILGYGSRAAYLEAEPTVEAKARDMVKHYLTHVFPTATRPRWWQHHGKRAVRYKRHLRHCPRGDQYKTGKSKPERPQPGTAQEAAKPMS